jgi:hypothetical protein
MVAGEGDDLNSFNAYDLVMGKNCVKVTIINLTEPISPT